MQTLLKIDIDYTALGVWLSGAGFFTYLLVGVLGKLLHDKGKITEYEWRIRSLEDAVKRLEKIHDNEHDN